MVAVMMGGEVLANDIIQPIPQTLNYNRSKALLGKKLFFDTHLSDDGTIACVSCHNTESGADTKPVSTGIKGQQGSANSPTVFNSYFNFRQMWSGSAKSLMDQVRMPVHNPIEMAMNEEKIVRYLRSNRDYARRFHDVFGQKATFDLMSNAIAEFEKVLITPNCRFDRYLRHEIVLEKDELEGYRLFKRLGCITCHNGINIGGNSFQKIGLIRDYKWSIQNPDCYSVTHHFDDKNLFKVPTLRNIVLTAPYFHDGSIPALREALKKMAYHNLGFTLSKKEIESLMQFLKTLTGEKPAILKDKP
jgi:cytochrome c peroxidase